ncbi:hypothetical protein CEUSTIGMA_g5417.t1 [Chlamydomonas eustigma]|uniref:Uncharacterized protein n=1 Tax=Chlamydomonas eustigma TaxID=1157962 RepID=A0A250X4H4_9CHLO|nr:hypothetical protein CEUSTIGMA_g5417.t1 [Chlamydomonas eustigma]|eukprot:GAX77975.1 hypothetical protein CEUSTIGMA_g5417.t1 [Chlamydomonas eustigma]
MLTSRTGNLCLGSFHCRESSPIQHTPVTRTLRKERNIVARAENSDRSDSFVSGFVLGGVVFGTLGFIFAPQISKALLGDDQRLKLPRFLEDEVKDPEQTKQDLFDKIAQLNASIDEVSNKLNATSNNNGSVASPVAEAMKIKT